VWFTKAFKENIMPHYTALIPGRAAGYPNGSPTDPDERN